MVFRELNLPFQVTELFEHVQDYPYSFLLDSANSQHDFGRYSFFGFSPFLIFKSKGEKAEIISPEGKKSYRVNPWEILANLFSHYQENPFDKLPFPFSCGAVGYFSYDLGRYLEEVPEYATDDLNLPECYLGFYDCVFVFDHWEKKSWICATNKTKLQNFEKKIYSRQYRADKVLTRKNKERFSSNFAYRDYLQAIKKAKEYIAAGDIYQVNLSQRFMCQAN